MSEYKQYRADFAKLAWVAALTTTHDSKTAAQKAVEWADDFISELERTEAQERLHGILAEAPQDEPPAPALPRLNTGWKWAEVGGNHKLTQWDKWLERDGTFSAVFPEAVGGLYEGATFRLATPDWHNPENIEDPGDGYRFLVKGEIAQVGDFFYIPVTSKWSVNDCPDLKENEEWTHRTQRPLPPVLAQDKEVQS